MSMSWALKLPEPMTLVQDIVRASEKEPATISYGQLDAAVRGKGYMNEDALFEDLKAALSLSLEQDKPFPMFHLGEVLVSISCVPVSRVGKSVEETITGMRLQFAALHHFPDGIAGQNGLETIASANSHTTLRWAARRIWAQYFFMDLEQKAAPLRVQHETQGKT